MVGNDVVLRQHILQLHHDNAIDGHGGMISTLHWLNHSYHWRGIKKDVYKHT